MEWALHGDVTLVADRVREFLEHDPLRHTVALNALRLELEGSRPQGAGRWWSVGTDDEIHGVVLETPGMPAVFCDVPDQAIASYTALRAELDEPLPGVNAPPAQSRAFARLWNGGVVDRQDQRLYVLGELRWPDPRPPGEARTATIEERALIIDWWNAFVAEAGTTPGDPSAAIDLRMEFGGLVLWWDEEQPVSLAGLSQVSAGMSRLGPVYTPPRLRGRGYAAGSTCAASARAMEWGATQVCLYTDLANPTSNALYQRLGYEPVEDRMVLFFG